MIKYKQLSTEDEALEDVRTNVEAVIGMQWMAVVWCVEDGWEDDLQSIRLVGRTTWRFPREKFEAAVELLRENLEAEKRDGEPDRPSPLKLAPFVSDLADGDSLVDQNMEGLLQRREKEEAE